MWSPGRLIWVFFHIDLGLLKAEVPSRLNIIGVHFNPYKKHHSIRRKQLKQLQKFITKMDEGVLRPSLKLIAGDFNIIGESSEYLNTIGGGYFGGRTDIYRQVRSDPGFTWNTKNPLTAFALGGAGSNERLDYILNVNHSRHDKVVEVSGIRINEFATNKYDKGFVSDHFGLLCDFDIIRGS